MPKPKGMKTPDLALRNKLRTGKSRNVMSTNNETASEALQKIEELEQVQDALCVTLQEHGITPPKGWKPIDLLKELRIRITKDSILEAIQHNVEVMKTHNSAIAANSFTQYVLDKAIGKTDNLDLEDEHPQANIIIFGKDDFNGVE